MERRLAWAHCLCSSHLDPGTGCFPSWAFSPGIPAKSAWEGIPGFWIVSASAADPSLPGWQTPCSDWRVFLRCAQEQRLYHCGLHSFPYLGKQVLPRIIESSSITFTIAWAIHSQTSIPELYHCLEWSSLWNNKFPYPKAEFIFFFLPASHNYYFYLRSTLVMTFRYTTQYYYYSHHAVKILWQNLAHNNNGWFNILLATNNLLLTIYQ